MGVETDDPAPGAVALETNVAVGMAGLTGGQRPTGLAGVADGPGVEIGSDGIAEMARIAWGVGVHAGMDRFHIGVVEAQLEAAPVRGAADVAAAHLEAVVTLVAVIGLVAA